LKPYGIQPRTIWINDRSAKGYLREDFEDVFGRYAAVVPEGLKKWLEGKTPKKIIYVKNKMINVVV